MTEEPRPGTRADIPAVAALFGKAFERDPIITWPFPPDSGRAQAEALFRILMSEEYGELDVTWLLGDLDAAAVWLPPEQAARFVEFEPLTRSSIEPLTDDAGARYAAFWDWIGAHVPDEDCWFLDILAVDPRARGRGLAGTLVRHGLARAFAEGLPAVLETSIASNVPLYEHLGFRVVEEAQAPGGGPRLWFMRAEPPG